MAVNKCYNSGVCQIGRETKSASSFSARQGATTISDVNIEANMDFAESSRRMEDSTYASQRGYQLDRKIAIRKPGNYRIDTESCVVIGRMLYHVGNVDYTDTEVYLYLTEVRELEEAEDDA